MARSFSVLAFGGIVVLAGCGSSSEPGAGADSQGIEESECPAEASSCPEGCNAGSAARYDEQADCWRPYAVITCQAPERRTFDLACGVRASDGAIFQGSGSVVGAATFSPCQAGAWTDAPGCIE